MSDDEKQDEQSDEDFELQTQETCGACGRLLFPEERDCTYCRG